MDSVIKVTYQPRSTFFDSLLLGRNLIRRAQSLAIAEVKELRLKNAKEISALKKQARKIAKNQAKKASLKTLGTDLIQHQRSYEEELRRSQADCLEFCLKLCTLVIGDRLKIDPKPLISKIKQEIEELVERRSLVIKVHPSLLDAIRNEMESSSLGASIRVEGMENIKPGNAEIETVAGSIQLDWQDHLNQLHADLRNLLAQSMDREANESA